MTLPAYAAVLRAAVGHPSWTEPGMSAWRDIRQDPTATQELFAAARYHRVTGTLALWLAAVQPDHPFREEMEAELGRIRRHHLQASGEVVRVGSALTCAGVGWATFKGPALAALDHRDPAHREYKDVDLLVHPRDFRTALDALAGVGVRMLDRNTGLLLEEGAGEVHLLTDWGTPIDLHWTFGYHAEARDRWGWRTGALLARRRRGELLGRPIWLLDPIDTVLHVAWHAVTDGGHRLVWTLDLARTLDTLHRAVGPDSWELLRLRAVETGTGLALHGALRRAGAELGLVSPPGYARSLGAGPVWRTLVDLSTRAAPPATTDNAGSPSRVLAHATRATGLASWRAAAAGAGRAGAELVGAGLAGHGDAPAAPRGVEAFVEDPGHPIEEFLDWVVQQPAGGDAPAEDETTRR